MTKHFFQNNRQNSHHNRLNARSQFEGAKRSTRSVSKPRHVEVLLVADKSMTDFHNQGNLETYLLTIMNMVSAETNKIDTLSQLIFIIFALLLLSQLLSC